MKTASVSLLLGVCVLLLSPLTVSAVSLSVSPNLQQFFSESFSVFMSCVDDGETVEGWTVKTTRGGHTEDCGAAADFRRVNSSFCFLDPSISSGGNFFCENSSGQQSDGVSISISADSLILEIPALPVMSGSDITLHCRKRDGDTVAAYFFFNGSLIGFGPKSEHTITNVRQSDEGVYSCSTSVFRPSPQSFLRVRGLPPHIQSSTACTSPGTSALPSSPTAFPPPLFSSSIVLVVAGLVSTILLVLVGVLFFCRKLKGRTDSSPPLEMTYADVTITQRANRREKHPTDPHAVYSDVRIHTSGPAEVAYGQVIFKNKKKVGRITGQSDDAGVVYSSVRAGN